jgi:RHS repeat-associated protein
LKSPDSEEKPVIDVNFYVSNWNKFTTTYTLDLAAGLTQILSDGSAQYLYGYGRLGEYSGDGWAYYTTDALGSVRQIVDESGEVVFYQSYEPYGEVRVSAGQGGSMFGFSGEQTDATGLQYLRARYYNTAIGRFLSRDPSGVESNLYVYASANPINLVDPTGNVPEPPTLGMSSFLFCIGIHTATKGNMPTITAQEAVDICRMGFNKLAWLGMTFNLEGLPKSAHDLFGMFLYEPVGSPDWLIFDATEPLTQELAASTLINDVRNWFYIGGDRGEFTEPTYHGGDTDGLILYKFGGTEYLATLIFDSRLSVEKLSLPLEFVMGSFYFQVQRKGDRLAFRIDNDMTLESGTHIRGRFPSSTIWGSVEGLLEDPRYAYLANEPVIEAINLINDRGGQVISILRSQSREDTTGFEGGGSLYQTYTWTEKYDPCLAGKMPWEVYPFMLDLQRWYNYEADTVSPDW